MVESISFLERRIYFDDIDAVLSTARANIPPSHPQLGRKTSSDRDCDYPMGLVRDTNTDTDADDADGDTDGDDDDDDKRDDKRDDEDEDEDDDDDAEEDKDEDEDDNDDDDKRDDDDDDDDDGDDDDDDGDDARGRAHVPRMVLFDKDCASGTRAEVVE